MNTLAWASRMAMAKQLNLRLFCRSIWKHWQQNHLLGRFERLYWKPIFSQCSLALYLYLSTCVSTVYILKMIIMSISRYGHLCALCAKYVYISSAHTIQSCCAHRAHRMAQTDGILLNWIELILKREKSAIRIAFTGSRILIILMLTFTHTRTRAHAHSYIIHTFIQA